MWCGLPALIINDSKLIHVTSQHHGCSRWQDGLSNGDYPCTDYSSYDRRIKILRAHALLAPPPERVVGFFYWLSRIAVRALTRYTAYLNNKESFSGVLTHSSNRQWLESHLRKLHQRSSQ